jgi:hypothetical protein
MSDLKTAIREAKNGNFKMSCDFYPANFMNYGKNATGWDEWETKKFYEIQPGHSAHWNKTLSKALRILKLERLREKNPQYCVKKEKNIKVKVIEPGKSYTHWAAKKRNKNKLNNRATGGIFELIKRDAAIDRSLLATEELRNKFSFMHVPGHKIINIKDLIINMSQQNNDNLRPIDESIFE